MFKSSWDLFCHEPHRRKFVVEGRSMWPHPWLNAVVWFLPLCTSRLTFLRSKTHHSVQQVGKRTGVSDQSERGRSGAWLKIWCGATLSFRFTHFQGLSCHQISLHVTNSVRTEWAGISLPWIFSFPWLGATECACVRSGRGGWLASHTGGAEGPENNKGAHGNCTRVDMSIWCDNVTRCSTRCLHMLLDMLT